VETNVVLQVPTLVDAVETPGKAGPKAPGNISSTSSKTSGSSSSSKGTPAASPAAAAGAGAGVLVITESAAGYDLCCPAGQYHLNLTHPAVRHMLGQLLELRSKLQQLQQQVKQQQLEQQPAKVAAAASSSSGGKAAAKRSSNDATTPGDSRSTSPVPSGGATPQGKQIQLSNTTASICQMSALC
jgi:hypothetical protein